MSNLNLTEKDVKNLLTNPSGEQRAETAAKIAASFDSEHLSTEEKQLAEDIFLIMVQDAEIRVREALSENLKENPNVPHEVALSLAQDVDQVSLPVLQFSEVLNDQDLTEIINSQGSEKQFAIAGRASVSEDVSAALVQTQDENVVAHLVENEGAEISDSSLETVVDTLGDSEIVQGAMINRPQLPVTVIERLVTVVSDNFKEQLANRSDLPAGMAEGLLTQSREKAVVGLSVGSDEASVLKLVGQLLANDRLTPSIVLRAACMGNILFLVCALAELADVNVGNARKLIEDSGELGLKSLFTRANLPETFFPAIQAAVEVEQETEFDGGENDRERFARRMIERILTQFGDLGVDMESEDLEYLLAKMNELPVDLNHNA
ncbi:MAG: DUF2336 domain-containing protein [Rhodospirillaceae bacterium]|nr:DUF2336 domain-containing protein [Rhodospirillaceae bacterium]